MGLDQKNAPENREKHKFLRINWLCRMSMNVTTPALRVIPRSTRGMESVHLFALNVY